MTAIFLSHRSADNAEAQALKDWLAAEGHERLFLDFDPEDGIPAGVDWEQRLYQELRRCQALLIVLTPAWLESKWCSNELAIAREKGKAVFVVRVEPCPEGRLIPSLQEVDLTVDREGGLQRLSRGLLEHGLDPRSAFDWKPDRPIYPGLMAFDIDDAAIFFGRSEQSLQAWEALRHLRMQASGSPKLLLITGASGSGKSSILRAGLLARLRKEPASWIVSRPVRKGGHAIQALAEAIAWTFPADRRPHDIAALASRLGGEKPVEELLALARELRFALDRPDATLVIALDQAEELLSPSPDASALLDLLRGALARSEQELAVVATLRSDQLGTWQQHPSIKPSEAHAGLGFAAFAVAPMPMTQIGEIVRGPAAYTGLAIDDGLVDALKADTGSPDALPLLAYALRTLNETHGADGALTLDEYEALGRLDGAIRNQANAVIKLDQIGKDDLQALREAFVPGLVRATVDGNVSRKRALLASLPKAAEPYLRKLVEARLLVLDSGPDGDTVEVVHEAVLRAWPLLDGWIWEDMEVLRRLESIQRSAGEFHRNHRDRDYLVHLDQRLAAAEDLARQPRYAAGLEKPERDYLAACRDLQTERDGQRRRRVWVAAVGSFLLLATAAIGGFFALQRQQETVGRLLDEATRTFRAGDPVGALVPLEKISAYPSILLSDEAGLLRRFWSADMLPLTDFVAAAGPRSVVEVNGKAAAILEDGTAQVPDATGAPLVRYEPLLGGFVFADARSISVRDGARFAPPLAIDAVAAAQVEAERVTPKEILSVPALGLVVIRLRTLEITNDEDEPEKWHASLTFLFRTGGSQREAVCIAAAPESALQPGCPSDSVTIGGGIVAVTHGVPEDGVIEPVATKSGSALAIRWSRRTECDSDDDDCEEKTIEHAELVRFDAGRLLLTQADPADVTLDEKVAIRSSADQPLASFPLVRPEEQNWRLSAAAGTAPPPTETVDRPNLDFHLTSDPERYTELYSTFNLNFLHDGADDVFWFQSPGGNSWVQYSGCRFGKTGLVSDCQDLGVTVVGAFTLESPDRRFVAFRHCQSFQGTLQLLDMQQITDLSIKAPVDFVVGFAISPGSDRLAALTDQNEVLIYGLDGSRQSDAMRRISLPREPGATGEESCDPGRAMAFVDETTVVGVSAGGRLFAVDIGSGEVKWFGEKVAEASAGTGQTIAVSPGGRFFAVYDSETVQLVSSATGLPLSGRFRPKALLASPPEFGVFETVDVGADGSIRVPCRDWEDACKGQAFERPAPVDADCGVGRFEQLTGRDVSGERLDPKALLSLPAAACRRSP